MKNKQSMIFGIFVATAILLAGSSLLYGAGGVTNPWGLNPSATGTAWTGTLVISGQIVDVSGLPAGGLSDTFYPLVLPGGYQDQVVKLKFFVNLSNNAKKNPATFSASGLGKDSSGYYLFYALGDYGSGRFGDALNTFLKQKVYPNLPGGPYTGSCALKSLSNDSNNVETQLRVDSYGRNLFVPETPLYYSATITIVTN
jgi:hypothetical protein